jgi:tripartite-type tricarboxylate transporter receptor subunit TctC
MLCLFASCAFAFPTKPVVLVVPFPPGGVVDVIGRLVADRLTVTLGMRTLVENRTGAGGTIGAVAVARSEPDGHTLLVGGAATHVFSPILYPSAGYDPVQGFAPIVQLSTSPLVLVVPASSPVTGMKDFEAFVLAQGDRLNYSSNGAGTFPHLAAELYRRRVGGKFAHIPYSGGSQALIALVSGEVGFSINHIAVVLPVLKGGKIKAIATTGRERSASFPQLPTFDEAGLKGFEASTWFGLFAPAGTPQPVIEKLNAAVTQALKTPELRDKLAALGEEAVGGSPEELAARVKSDLAKWPPIIREAGVKAN